MPQFQSVLRKGGGLVLVGAAMGASITSVAAAAVDRSADLAMLRGEYLAKEEALTPEARQRAERLLSRVEARADAKSNAEFVIAAMQLTALADSGGSLVLPASREGRPPRLPVRLAMFDDGLLVVRATGEARGIAGATLVAVDGHPVSRIAAHVASLFGGAEPRRRTLLPMVLEAPELLHAIGVGERPDRLRLTLVMPDGQQVETVYRASDDGHSSPPWWPDRWSSDGFDKSQWSHAAPAELPLYLRNFTEPLRDMPLGEGGRYIQLKWTPAWDREAGLGQVQQALAKLEAEPPSYVAIDLRFDHGASSPQIAAALAQSIAKLPPHVPVFLLVGRYTHHDGIVSATQIMRAGGSRAVAIGEPMGDWLDGPRWGGRLCFRSVSMCATFSRLPQGGTVDRSPAEFPILPAPPTAAGLRRGSDPALDLARQLARQAPGGGF